ncbi:MAG TPA: PLP-dependent transferase [Actinomycetota bacterium]|nr:PLP-dependent transferase [Actinomycetota bacterium]
MFLRRRAALPPTGELDAAFDELAADLGELERLASDAAERLRSTGRDLLRHRRDLDGDSLDLIEEQLRRLSASYEAIRRTAGDLRRDAHLGPRSPELLAGLTAERGRHADRLRTLQGMAAAVIVASEWQSPSFAHSILGNAGRRAGTVRPHEDDYRRDRHPDAAAFEDVYLAAYVDPPDRLELRALATSCGMSAFTTILGFLLLEGKLEPPILMGASVYHECRDLVRATVPGDGVVEVSEHPPDLLPDAIRRLRPRVVFLDSIGNAPGTLVPDVPSVIGSLDANVPGAYLVLDNTGLSCTFRPFELIRGRRGIRLLAFESLTKYAQFGMDRVAGGIVLAGRRDGEDLDRYREHLGANIPDASVLSIPRPDRAALERRLARLERNAILLASRVRQAAVATGDVAVTGADHPALPDHPSHRLAQRLGFRGGWFSLRFAAEADRPVVHERFLHLAMDEARRRRVPLIAGASFGLDTTRVYATASTARYGRPFVRVSPGIEHARAIERTGDVLAAAVVRLAEEVGGLRPPGLEGAGTRSASRRAG